MTDMTRRQFLLAGGSAAVSVFCLKVPLGEAGEGRRGVKTYAFLVDTTSCIGCGNCVRACSRENKVPEGSYRTWVERYTVTDAGKTIVESPEGGIHGFLDPVLPEGQKPRKAFFVPKLCNQCAEPPCVQVCPVGATFRTPEGAVLVDEKWCVGCAYCIQSCPYSARFFNWETHTADKCTWCYHRITRGLEPACVEVCPVKARQFGEVTPGSEMEEILGTERLNVLKQDLGTDPKVYYRGFTREIR